MAVIRDDYVLGDQFSATFSQFIKLGRESAGASELAASAARNYQTVLNGLGG